MSLHSNFIGIHHASFIISDLEKSEVFYCHVLGFSIDTCRPNLGFDGLWLNINGQQQIHLLMLDNPDPLERPKHGGRDRHIAIRVKDLNLVSMQLDKADIAYTLSKSGREALFCRDPDGNTLEIIT